MTGKKQDFKMTDEQKGLFDKLKPLQREVALNSISGMNDIDSYKASSGKAKTEKAMRVCVSQILANLNVKAFLDSMKAAAVSSAVMSRERMLEIHTQIAEIGTSQLDGMSLDELSEYKNALDIKLKAMNQLATLAGYNAAQKYDHQSSDGSMSPVAAEMTDEQLLRIASEAI